MKKLLSVLVVFTMLITMLAGCGNSKKTIGIIKFGSHASLDNCYDGIVKGLEESGINLDDYNVEY